MRATVGAWRMHYDVIIIGSGRRRRDARAHPGRLGQVDPAAGARGLPAPGDGQLGSAAGVRGRPVHVQGHLVRRATASRSSRRCTTSSAGRPSCTARPCTGCARRTSGRSGTSTGSRRPGRCPTTTSSRGTPRPSGCTRCTATAARTRPRATAASPTRGPRSRTSTGSSRSPTAWRRAATTRSTRRAASCWTRRTGPGAPASAAPGVTATRAWCTPSPTPRSSPSGRLLDRGNVTLLTGAEVTRLETDESGRTVTGVVVCRDGNREVYAADIVARLRRRRQQRQDPAQFGHRHAPERAWRTARTRSDATTCSTTARRSWPWPRSRTTPSSRRRWASTTSTSPPRTTSGRWATSR